MLTVRCIALLCVPGFVPDDCRTVPTWASIPQTVCPGSRCVATAWSPVRAVPSTDEARYRQRHQLCCVIQRYGTYRCPPIQVSRTSDSRPSACWAT